MRRAVRGSAVGVALVLVGILLAGCGSSSHTSQTTALTHKEFVAKLSAVCKRINTRGENLQHRLGAKEEWLYVIDAGLIFHTNKPHVDGRVWKLGPDDYAKYAALLEAARRVNRPVRVAATAKLTPPPADAAKFARYKELWDRIARVVDREIVALKAKDLDEAGRLENRWDDLSEAVFQLAQFHIGTQYCNG